MLADEATRLACAPRLVAAGPDTDQSFLHFVTDEKPGRAPQRRCNQIPGQSRGDPGKSRHDGAVLKEALFDLGLAL